MSPYNNLLEQLKENLARFQVQGLIRPLVKYVQLFVTFLSVFTDNYNYYPRQANVTDGQVFDYIVIGAGTAGCVVANRLTENPNITLLLVEAGGVPSLASDVLGAFPLLDRDNQEWKYYSTNDGYSSQAHIKKVVHLTAGKMLGGSGGINYNVYNRGAKDDYDKWADLGNEGWDWKSVLKYFKRSEYLDDAAILRSDTASLHGMDGPIHVRRPDWTVRNKNYLKGFKQAGYETLFDINGYKHIGYGMSQFNNDGFNRQSTAIAYLRPIRNRLNLSLLMNAFVTKIIINKNKIATGVKILLNNGESVSVYTRKEVILCAGAFNSPKLLMLSGVGPAPHLKDKNISVIVHSPSVGENFIDTPLVFQTLTGDGGFLDTFGRNVDLIASLYTFPNPLFIGHGVLNKSQSYPDYQTNVFPVPASSIITATFYNSIFTYGDEISITAVKAGIDKETIIAAHSLLHPESRGCVKLRSNDHKDAPIITTGYYSNPKDLKRHARYMEDYIKVTKTDVFRKFNSEVIYVQLKECEELELGSYEYWKCYILNAASPMFNFAGTCAMGPKSVVDARLRVRGVYRVRVADASIMPRSISGNNYAAVVMIGEKASDMIKKDNAS